MPNKLQEKENISAVTYKLGNNIINKILSYKKVLNSIGVDEEISFSLTTDPFGYEKSWFCDPYRKHIITGDLRITENSKLRKLLTNGLNYREARCINFSKAYK